MKSVASFSPPPPNLLSAPPLLLLLLLLSYSEVKAEEGVGPSAAGVLVGQQSCERDSRSVSTAVGSQLGGGK